MRVLGKRAGLGNMWALGCSHKKNGESTLQQLWTGQQAAGVGEACRRERDAFKSLHPEECLGYVEENILSCFSRTE